MVTDLLLQTTRENLTGLLFCLDLRLSVLVIVIFGFIYFIVSSPQAVRSTTLSFHLSVNMYVFNVKSYTESECYKQ